MSTAKIHLLVIDPQRDFCDPSGSLFVPGANEDMNRLAGLIGRLGPHLADIHVTVDSHQEVDISHPMWWKDRSGRPPGAFTLISASDLADGVWTTTQPGCFRRSLDYLQTLEGSRRGGASRYPHTIWPYHCVIGSEGHGLYPELRGALHDWCVLRFATVDFVTKGSNPWTEHFSGVKAEVPDPSDPTTQLNTRLVQTLEEADVVLMAGEALSHCLLSTVEDVAEAFADPATVRKMVLLTDATSPVPDPPMAPGLFTGKVKQFLTEMKAKGMRTATCADFLA